MKVITACISIAIVIISVVFYLMPADDLASLDAKSEQYKQPFKDEVSESVHKEAPKVVYPPVVTSISEQTVDKFSHELDQAELWLQSQRETIFRNEYCRLVQSYETKTEFITEMHAFAGDVDDHRLEEDFEQCSSYQPLTWPELESKYISLVDNGVREAELILASVLPNGMTNGRRWTLRALTWSEQAAVLLTNNFDDFRFDEDQKYFLSMILPFSEPLRVDMASLSISEQNEIENLATLWNSGTEDERRGLLTILFTDL